MTAPHTNGLFIVAIRSWGPIICVRTHTFIQRQTCTDTYTHTHTHTRAQTEAHGADCFKGGMREMSEGLCEGIHVWSDCVCVCVCVYVCVCVSIRELILSAVCV